MASPPTPSGRWSPVQIPSSPRMRKALLPLLTKGSRAFCFVWDVPVVGAAASFSALLVLVLRFRGSLLGVLLGVLLGAQSLRLVLFLGFFLVDDLCEELLHLLGHAGG